MFFNYKQNYKEISSPMDLRYMKRIKFHLHFMGGWPLNELYEAYREKTKYIPLRHFKFLLVFWSTIFINSLFYLKFNLNKLDFFKLGQVYIVIFMTAVALQRVSMPFMESYRKTVADFVLKIHLFHHKQRSNYAMKVHKEVHKILEYLTTWILIELYVGTSSFHLIPLYNNIRSGVFTGNGHSVKNGTLYEYAMYFYIPFEQNNIIFIFIFIISLILIFDIGSAFCTYDLLMSTIIIHVWGHLKILIHHLENFPRPEADKYGNKENDFRYNKKESRVIFEMLKENIEHHKLIMGFMNSVSNAFGVMMFVYYIFHQITGCILLLEISALNAEAFVTYGLLTAFMYQQLIQTSFIFELIGSKSEIIKDAVYGLPWECMDVKNKRIVLFFLYNVQAPIRLNAMGLIAVGVQTAAAVSIKSF
uniref:Odorant receptor n=1 Tax=Heliconius melpomene rosina TaxID=171916 RepID=A0A1S5XXJ6_HELME|nr:olfactory receptor 10 [Heliconius melpomene rosina]